jgi:hypothetical protein
VLIVFTVGPWNEIEKVSQNYLRIFERYQEGEVSEEELKLAERKYQFVSDMYKGVQE